MKRCFLWLCAIWVSAAGVEAQEQERYRSPVDIPLLLSGNFGEPRPNHFHAGLDVKTQGVEGKRVLAVSDGYVSRVTVGYFGFGNAVYLTHPDGYITVYCHLREFIPAIREKVTKCQYEEESERVDVQLEPYELVVSSGDLIAYSGNTGSSLAPHLHLELHRESDGALVDPMPFFRHLLKDDISPVVHGVKLYPYPGGGLVEGVGRATTFTVTADASGRVVSAWGRVGAAVWADDLMNDTNNKFGVRCITLRVDGKQVFSSLMDEIMPEEHLFVNSWGDYAHYRKTKHWYLKSFVDPGNTLSILSANENDGWVDIDEERNYIFEYELEDLAGNVRTCRFTVRGVRQDALLASEAERERVKAAGGTRLSYDRPQVLQRPGLELRFPACALVEDVTLNPRMEVRNDGISNRFTLHGEYVPLVKKATLMLAPRETPAHPDKCYISSSRGYVGGDYQDGWYSAQIRDLCESYQLAVDTVAPKVRWLSAIDGRSVSKLRCSVVEEDSGIDTFKAYVDGQFVLFTADGGVYTCRLADTPLKQEGKSRKLTVRVTDRCGNVTEDTRTIVY